MGEQDEGSEEFEAVDEQILVGVEAFEEVGGADFGGAEEGGELLVVDGEGFGDVFEVGVVFVEFGE